MVPLLSLWLPILGSAILVFLASSLMHTVLGYHANDFRKLPDEEGARRAMGSLGIPPGQYVIPYAGSSGAMKSPEYAEKMRTGPVAMLNVRPNGPFEMGKSLGLWFLYIVVVSLFAAYIASRALGAEADYLDVFRFAGTTAFAGYSLALVQESIWYWRDWRTTLINVADGLVYALLTAGVFGWLWPA